MTNQSIVPARDLEGFLPLDQLRATALTMSREQFVETCGMPALFPVSVRGNPAPPPHELTPMSGKRVVSFKRTITAAGTRDPETEPDDFEPIAACGIPYDRRIGILAKRPKNLFPHMISIGRAMTSDLVYLIDTVSKFHGYFVQKEGRWSFTDQRSSNGTAINGDKLPPGTSRAVADRDKISFGSTVETLFLLPASLYDSLRLGLSQ